MKSDTKLLVDADAETIHCKNYNNGFVDGVQYAIRNNKSPEPTSFKSKSEQYAAAKKFIKTYEREKMNAPVVISEVCKMNKEPKECHVNLYTKNGCSTCYYYIKKD